MNYAYLLKTAASMDDTETRIEWVATFAVSALVSRPFCHLTFDPKKVFLSILSSHFRPQKSFFCRTFWNKSPHEEWW
jgi:hypothetical protein